MTGARVRRGLGLGAGLVFGLVVGAGLASPAGAACAGGALAQVASVTEETSDSTAGQAADDATPDPAPSARLAATAPPGAFALARAHGEALDVVRGELDELLARGGARHAASGRSAVALATLALLRAGDRGAEHGDAERVGRVLAAWLDDAASGPRSGSPRAEADELLVLATLLERAAMPSEASAVSPVELSALGAHRVRALGALRTANGGWTSAGGAAGTETTAHVVLALAAARSSGLPVADDLLQGALAGLRRARLDVQVVTPGLWPLDAADDGDGGRLLPAASVTRVQAVHRALAAAGEPPPADDVLRGLDAFQRHHRVLDLALRHKDGGASVHGLHAEQYLAAHLAAARLLPRLSRAERVRFSGRLALDVLATRRADGAYVDGSHGGHGRLVGTARAALALGALRDA